MIKKEKNHINVVVIGHLQSGKTTTVGQLIYKLGGVDKRTIQKIDNDSIGMRPYKYYWLMTKLKVEK